jgi:hypothetical protein
VRQDKADGTLGGPRSRDRWQGRGNIIQAAAPAKGLPCTHAGPAVQRKEQLPPEIAKTSQLNRRNRFSDAAVRDTYRVLRELADSRELLEELRGAEAAFNRLVCFRGRGRVWEGWRRRPTDEVRGVPVAFDDRCHPHTHT